MKHILLLGVLFVSFVSFTPATNNEIDGMWIGYYRSNMIKEKIIVRLSSTDKMEFYAGGVDEKTLCNGSYTVTQDSVVFLYKTLDGAEVTMKGRINGPRTFMNGSWKDQGKSKGSFYLERRVLKEYYAKL